MQVGVERRLRAQPSNGRRGVGVVVVVVREGGKNKRGASVPPVLIFICFFMKLRDYSFLRSFFYVPSSIRDTYFFRGNDVVHSTRVVALIYQEEILAIKRKRYEVFFKYLSRFHPSENVFCEKTMR